ncbi:MAG: ABC transporter ATP-binding protein [Dehalococcoidales bacterium]|nr:ABC transporter ATP-binding protein [Dehalococcoidales bacterium]
MVLFLLAGSLEAATIAAVYPILEAAFAPGAETTNFILSAFQTIAGWIPISDLFVSYCAVFMIVAVLTFLVKLAAINFRIRFIAYMVAGKQNEIYKRFMRADYQYFIDHKQGELLYNTINAPQQLSTLVSSITELISQILLSLSVLILLFSLSWAGATGILVLGLSYFFLSRFLGTRVSYDASSKELQAIRESNVVFNESVSGIKQIKVFAVTEDWISIFQDAIKKRWGNSVRRLIWQQLLPIMLLLVIYIAVGVVVLLIKLINPAGYLELIPVFGAFAFAVFRLIPFVSSVGTMTMSIQASLPDCEAMHRILNTEITGIIDGDSLMDSFDKTIQFRDVSFSYKGRTETVRNLSLEFEKGKTTAIVGRSGSGKTTVVSLLLRLFDVDSGEILIDGHNIKDLRIDSLLKNIGYVSQDTFILNDSIEKNITFGSDKYSLEQVVKAAEYADAHSFISDMPEGYNTVVGDKGMRLSGGQAQRIAVARAMIRDPEILIFDEATNNLDNISEMAVQKAIEEISKQHTVILVAHRLSTIENADKIVLIEKGAVKEEGTHTELLEKRGEYWKLHQRQTE